MSDYQDELAKHVHGPIHDAMVNRVIDCAGLTARAANLAGILDDSDFWVAPASSRHHLNRIGGLVLHCFHVMDFLNAKHNPGHEEQNFMLAFTHDLCKTNIYKGAVTKSFEYYTPEEMAVRERMEDNYKKALGQDPADLALFHVKDEFPDFKAFLYGKGKVLRTTYDVQKVTFAVDDALPLGHGEKSVIIALKAGVDLTDEEIIAIRWHMGFDDKNWPMYRANVHQRCYDLAMALQRADQDATNKENKER